MEIQDSINNTISKAAEYYSSQMVSNIVGFIPNLDETLKEIIKELTQSAFRDGATMVTNCIKDYTLSNHSNAN